MKLSKSEAGKLGAIKSREIKVQQKQERIENYNKNKNECTLCEKHLEYFEKNKKFCSSSCSAKFFNEKRKKNILCLNCNNSLGSNRSSKQKYCNHKCQQEHRRKEKYQKIFNGNTDNITSSFVKKYLVDLHGSKCMNCDWDKINPTTGKCPIELEHIDGNSSNNKLDNLKLLCPSCHSLTPTYKALNKGKGRHSRTKRYHEGKSY